MSRPQAIALTIFINLLWSTAGVVTKHLDSAASFEVTFWRSSFNAMALIIALSLIRGPGFLRKLLHAPKIIWISGVCWAIMFTAFMVALTLTTVANVLIIMALGPLITALFTRIFLKHRLPKMTWLAIAIACFGIIWMFLNDKNTAFTVTGSLISLAVPLAGAVNFTIMQHVGLNRKSPLTEPAHDMLQTVLIGAVLSALATLPIAWPFQATSHDLSLLALLGCFQQALPCLLVIRLTRELPAPELSLLGQLEVIFGVTWAWLWAGEPLSANTISGGLLVIGALISNELFRIYRQRRVAKLLT